MDGAKGFPHAAHDMCRLRGNRDDFATLYLRNLLVFEPGIVKQCQCIDLNTHNKIK